MKPVVALLLLAARIAPGGDLRQLSIDLDEIREGEELVEQPFRRLIDKRKLGVFRYRGFWQSMDTFKDKITLDRMEARGDCPWMVWKRPRPA